MIRIIVIFFAFAAMSACAANGTGGGASQSGWMRLVYACSGGHSLHAAFSPGGDHARIDLDGISITMMRSLSASGAAYRAETGHVLDAGHRSATLRGPDGSDLRSACVPV